MTNKYFIIKKIYSLPHTFIVVYLCGALASGDAVVRGRSLHTGNGIWDKCRHCGGCVLSGLINLSNSIDLSRWRQMCAFFSGRGQKCHSVTWPPLSSPPPGDRGSGRGK